MNALLRTQRSFGGTFAVLAGPLPGAIVAPSQPFTLTPHKPTIEAPRRRLTLDDFDRYQEVIDRLNADIAADPENAQARYNKGAWMLSAGNFTPEAWTSLGWRLFLEGVTGDYTLFPIEVWDDHDITGKNIFVWLEQGIGDQIQAGSFINDAVEKCASVTVYCNRRVWPLFKRSFPKANILKPGQLNGFKQYDYQMTFSDLGNALRKSFDDFKPHTGYLKADPERVAHLRAKYQAIAPGNKIIGISWRSINTKIGAGKSLYLHQFSDIINMPGVTCVSLQYAEDVYELGQHKLYRDPEINQIWDMDGFAAQVAAMDGVISISNTALHVAGALGVPTLGLLSRGGCRNWYWFNDRKDCPWYPSVELVRQELPEQWSLPLARMKEWARG